MVGKLSFTCHLHNKWGDGVLVLKLHLMSRSHFILNLKGIKEQIGHFNILLWGLLVNRRKNAVSDFAHTECTGGGGGGGANGIKWRKWRITHGFFHFLHRKSLHFIPFYAILCHWKIEKSGISRKLIFDKVSISKNKRFYLLWFYILVSTNLNEQYSGRAAVGQMSPNHTFLWRKWNVQYILGIIIHP